MLNRSQPKGPAAVSGKQKWNKSEKKVDFHLDTGLATGVFGAPWGVKGSGWETDPGRIRFEFVFSFTKSIPGERKEKASIKFSGSLDFREQAFPYADSADFEGWRVQWISHNERKAKPAENGLTLKALRQKAKNPNEG